MNKALLTGFRDPNGPDICTVYAEADCGNRIYDDDAGEYVEYEEGFKTELFAKIPEPVVLSGGEIGLNVEGQVVQVVLIATAPDGATITLVPKASGGLILWQEAL